MVFLKFAPGGSLADEAVSSRACLPESAIWAYARDVARGLEYLHTRSLVHGDVKARNVVIGDDGRDRLTDFGCARAVDSLLPMGGTPAFMARRIRVFWATCRSACLLRVYVSVSVELQH